MLINNRKIGPNEPPYIIAELSANHNGSIELAFQSIAAAKACGASAIKIQTYEPSTMTIDCDRDDFKIRSGLWAGYTLYELYSKAYTPFEWHARLFEYAEAMGITIFSTPFDESAVELLEQLNTPAYKIASFELTDLPLIRAVARTGKPLFISTGMASLEEVSDAVDTARGAGCTSLLLFHCISSYPASVSEANLGRITELKRRFNTLTGLSDHTIGNTAAIAAIALGGCAIEKHFILDRRETGPDSEFSIEPSELRDLVVKAEETWQAMKHRSFIKSEEHNKIFRRSLYFVKPLRENEEITSEHIRRIRPGYGLHPKYLDQVVGKKVRRSVVPGEPVTWDLLQS